MQKEFSYRDYVSDSTFLTDYNAYQKKYSETIRESDRKIIDTVRDIVSRQGDRGSFSLLDIGCSTGNFLLHLKRLVPHLDLCGGDLAQSSLDLCRKNPELAGIEFAEMDILALPQRQFDIVVVNAVLYMFDDAEYQQALESIYGTLKSNGMVILFDFAHPFEQEVTILETTKSHPDGLRLQFRSEKKVQAAFEAAGFDSFVSVPFVLPVDLPLLEDRSQIITYTRTDAAGERMAFRGVLYQPWSHMTAEKARDA